MTLEKENIVRGGYAVHFFGMIETLCVLLLLFPAARAYLLRLKRRAGWYSFSLDSRLYTRIQRHFQIDLSYLSFSLCRRVRLSAVWPAFDRRRAIDVMDCWPYDAFCCERCFVTFYLYAWHRGLPTAWFTSLLATFSVVPVCVLLFRATCLHLRLLCHSFTPCMDSGCWAFCDMPVLEKACLWPRTFRPMPCSCWFKRLPTGGRTDGRTPWPGGNASACCCCCSCAMLALLPVRVCSHACSAALGSSVCCMTWCAKWKFCILPSTFVGRMGRMEVCVCWWRRVCFPSPAALTLFFFSSLRTRWHDVTMVNMTSFLMPLLWVSRIYKSSHLLVLGLSCSDGACFGHYYDICCSSFVGGIVFHSNIVFSVLFVYYSRCLFYMIFYLTVLCVCGVWGTLILIISNCAHEHLTLHYGVYSL